MTNIIAAFKPSDFFLSPLPFVCMYRSTLNTQNAQKEVRRQPLSPLVWWKEYCLSRSLQLTTHTKQCKGENETPKEVVNNALL